MSILMDALKQQQPIPAVAPSSNLWRTIAVVLGLILALILGAAGGYFLLPTMPTTSPAAIAATAIPVTEAEPEQILAALDSLEILANASDITEPLANIRSSANKTATVKTDTLKVQQPIVTVTTTTAETSTATANNQADNVDVKANSNPPVETAEVEISAALRDKFSSALRATEYSNAKPSRRITEAPAADISELAITIRQSIPSIAFEAHVYATAAQQRWVKVNGKTLQENQWVTADIKIKEITAQFVLLEYGNTLFSMAALSSWSQR